MATTNMRTRLSKYKDAADKMFMQYTVPKDYEYKIREDIDTDDEFIVKTQRYYKPISGVNSNMTFEFIEPPFATVDSDTRAIDMREVLNPLLYMMFEAHDMIQESWNNKLDEDLWKLLYANRYKLIIKHKGEVIKETREKKITQFSEMLCPYLLKHLEGLELYDIQFVLEYMVVGSFPTVYSNKNNRKVKTIFVRPVTWL